MSVSPNTNGDELKALNALNPVLQHRSRLGICVLLSKGTAMSFARLKDQLGETDGNLGAQLRKLEDLEYVTVKKEFVNRRPVSWYSLTRTGKQALKSHLDAMETVIDGSRVR